MITDIQKGWLEDILSGKITKAENPRKYSAYMRRIQERIDHGFINLVWLADCAPDLLKFEEREFDDPAIERHMRLKQLLSVCVKLNPYNQDPTLIKLLSQMIPQYTIELVKKPLTPPTPMVVFECQKCKGTFEDIDMKKEGECPYCGHTEMTLVE